MQYNWTHYALLARKFARNIETGDEELPDGTRLDKARDIQDINASTALSRKYSQVGSKAVIHTYKGGSQEIHSYHTDGSEGLFVTNGNCNGTRNQMDIEIEQYVKNNLDENKIRNKKRITEDMKRTNKVRLTESQLRRVIKESVKKILSENNNNVALSEDGDLGLPSGTKWAPCNIGANNPWETGNYYRWGEIEPYVKGEATGKYDDNKQFEDVAQKTMGGGWHLPSKEQLQELLNNTESYWYTLNGMKGRLFTSKTNGKSIFIPAAGYNEGYGPHYIGTCNYLWTNSPSGSQRYYSYVLYFNSGDYDVTTEPRYCGFSCRGVLG